MTTWRKEIEAEMAKRGETWADVDGCTLSGAGLDAEFHDGYEGTCGAPFTVWTAGRVYFPACYDGAEWVASVPRYPCGEATEHVGGG